MWTEIELRNGACTVHLSGRFVTGSDADYLRVREELERLTFGTLLLDCREVAYLDSTGIAFVVGMWKTAGESGAKFGLIGPNGRVQEVLRLCQLQRFLPIVGIEPAGASSTL